MRLGKRDALRALRVAVLAVLAWVAIRAIVGPSMRPFSVWDEDAVDEDIAHNLRRGQWATGSEQPDKSVNAYPPLRSDRPLYGSIRFDGVTSPEAGPLFRFVLDESAGPGKGYDRLYFDANRDGDLTNDAPVGLAKEPWPPETLGWRYAFEYFDVPIDHGPGFGIRPLRVLPSIKIGTAEGKTYASVNFVAAIAYKGTIRIGSRRYRAVLGQAGVITGRFDRPYASLNLIPLDRSEDAGGWWDADRLYAMHCIDGRWYRVSAAPTGERLFVEPYDGQFGVFEIGPGQRQLIRTPNMSGSLHNTDRAVPVGRFDDKRDLKPSGRCELPVGDYAVVHLNVELGRLRIGMSENYHAEGKRRGAFEKPRAFPIQIRPDKPFVLDFSSEPKVIFVSPAKDRTFKPGDTIEVAALLIDPSLDVMIRDLYTTAPLTPEEIAVQAEDSQRADAETRIEPRPGELRSLDPIVSVTDLTGKEVSRGKMPFG